MSKKSKIFLGIAIVLLILTTIIVVYAKLKIVVIKEKTDAKVESLVENKKQELIEEMENKDQVIGINNCFLGKVDNEGNWKSANKLTTSAFKTDAKINVNYIEMTYEDVLENDFYYIYDKEKLQGKRSDIFYDKDLNPEYYNEVYYFRFNTYDYIQNNNDSLILVSKPLDTAYEARLRNIEDFSSYEKYVQALLDEKNIKAEVNIEECIGADINTDGVEEIYVLANSITDDMGYPDENVGAYSYFLKIENDEVFVLLERSHNKEEIQKEETVGSCYGIRNINIADLNNDGTKEIIAEAIVWDIPEIYVFTQNENKEIELCLYGDFAW